MPLTAKQAAFVREYLVDLNATQAAIRAGYSPKTAEQQGFQLLKKTSVAQAVAAAQQERAKRTEITADRVLQELARLAFFDLRRLYREDGSMLSPHEWDDDTAAAVAGLEVYEELGNEEPEEEQEAQAHGGSLKRSRGRRVVLGFTKKAKTHDKGAALALAMRHLGLLKDKLEHSGEVQVVINKLTAAKGDGTSR